MPLPSLWSRRGPHPAEIFAANDLIVDDVVDGRDNFAARDVVKDGFVQLGKALRGELGLSPRRAGKRDLVPARAVLALPLPGALPRLRGPRDQPDGHELIDFETLTWGDVLPIDMREPAEWEVLSIPRRDLIPEGEFATFNRIEPEKPDLLK